MKNFMLKACLVFSAVFCTRSFAVEQIWTPNLIQAIPNGNFQVRFAESGNTWYTVYASSSNAATNSGCMKMYIMLLDAYNNGRRVRFDYTGTVINWVIVEAGI